MSLRDVQMDVVLLLEAAGLGSTTSNPPTLFAGQYPASAPDAFMAARYSGGTAPARYLANTGQAYYTPTVTVLVRGEPHAHEATRQRAVAAWEALQGARPAGYVQVEPEDAGPNELVEDESSRPRFSFTVRLEYAAQTGPASP